MSQLVGANICGSDRSIERRLYRWQRQWRKLPDDTGCQGYQFSSI